MARDAAEISPKFVPDDALIPRDDSGGIDFDPRTGAWDDGGKVTGGKAYLSANGAGSAGPKDERPKEKKISARSDD